MNKGFRAPGRRPRTQGTGPSKRSRIHPFETPADSRFSCTPLPGNFLRVRSGTGGAMQRAMDGPRADLRPKAWASIGPMVVSSRPSSPSYTLHDRTVFGDPIMDPSFTEARRTPSPAVYSPMEAARSDRPMSPLSSLHAALPDETYFHSNSPSRHRVGPGDHTVAREPLPHGAQVLSHRASSPASSLASRGCFGDPMWTDSARHGVGPGGVGRDRAGRPDLRTPPAVRIGTGRRYNFERERGWGAPGPGQYQRDEGDIGTRSAPGGTDRRVGRGGRAPRGRSSPAHSLGSRDSWKRTSKQWDLAGPARERQARADDFADRASAPRFSFGMRHWQPSNDVPGPGAYG